jgi:kynurenine formamidase
MRHNRAGAGRGRRRFLRTSAAAGVGLAVSRDEAAAQSTPIGELRLSEVRLIDLSVSLEHDAAGELGKPKIEYVTHEAGGLQGMMEVFGAKPEHLVYSKGHGWAVENLAVSSHTATHIDAPYHYGAMSEGKPARRIDEVPLKWFFGPGVVLDMRHRRPGEVISIADLQQKLRDINYSLSPHDIVLIHTGAAKRWGTPDYFRQPGLDRESTLWLVEQGIHVIGIVRGPWIASLRHRSRSSSGPATAGRSGPRTLRVSPGSTARLRSWRTWICCPARTASTCRAFP